MNSNSTTVERATNAGCINIWHDCYPTMIRIFMAKGALRSGKHRLSRGYACV